MAETAETDRRMVTVDQYDEVIERLTKERTRAASVIGDPVQRNRRHRRRALLFGLVMLENGSSVHPTFLEIMRSSERDDDAHQSVLWDEVLTADGWKKQGDGSWSLPAVKVAADEPPSK